MAALALLVALPVWVPVAIVVDVVRGHRRLPVLRLLAFALCWAWLEMAGIATAIALWCAGQARNLRAHFALQRWWARNLITALRTMLA